MELNLDIQGQLLPNIATVIVQLLATLVLFVVAKKLLWKPAKKYLDDKAALVQKPLEDAMVREEAARKANEEADKRLTVTAAKVREMIETGQKEGQKVKDGLIEEGQKQVDQMMETAYAQIENEKAKMELESHDQIVDVAMEAAKKLMKDQVSGEEHRKAIEDFVREVSNG